MPTITLAVRTTKTEGTVNLRFRLRDGRDTQLFHKSNISADLRDLEKFSPDGELKPRVKVYNTDLKADIDSEKEVMLAAYQRMKDKGLDVTSDVFESEIEKIYNPVLDVRAGKETLVQRFRRYAEESHRDGVIGDERYRHFRSFADKLERFVIINGLSQIVPEEVDPNFIMDYRNFIINEYRYVEKYKNLYKDLNRKNKPVQALSINTAAFQIKVLQSFFAQLDDNDEISKSPFRKLGKERRQSVVKTLYDDPVFLYADELAAVREAKVPDKLRSTRDAFILQCAIGCRVGDFQTLTMDNVSVAEDGFAYVHYLPHKTADRQDTNTEIQTPLVRFAVDIVRESGFKFPALKYVFGQTGYNAQIKALLEIVGIDRKVPVFNEEKKCNDYVELHKLGSSKLCRKTHVDMMNKVQINKYAAGLHKKGSSAVDRYTSMGLKDRFDLMNAAFGQEGYKVDDNLNFK